MYTRYGRLELHPPRLIQFFQMLGLVVSCLGASRAVWAAEAIRQTQQPIANFAFASQLGAGVYSVDGRSVQIYRLPFHWEFRPPTQDAYGLDLTLPVTLGFYGYRVEDVVHQGLPKSVDTYSLLPGLEISRLFGERWRAAAFAEIGVATTVQEGTDKSLIYDTGLRARYLFRMGNFYSRYAKKLIYAGSQVSRQDSDTMVRLSNGLDVRHRTSMSMRGETVDFDPYLLNEWYIKRPSPPPASPGPPMAELQWEVGVTIGAVNTAYLWKVPIPRIGLGYRFGGDLSIVRLVFGSAF